MRHLKNSLISFHILFLLLITSNPFRFGPFETMGNISWYWSWTDAPANILLFIPLGLVLRLSGASLFQTILIGAIVSGSIELLQLFSTRATSPIDFSLNLIGVLLASVWQPNQAQIHPLRQAMALVPPLWSIGLLWPVLLMPFALSMAAVLSAAGAWLTTPSTQSSWTRLTIIGWVALACAPIASNDMFSAALLIFFGSLIGLCKLPRLCLNPLWLTLLACITVSILFLLATPPLQWPLTVWSGHTLILMGGLCLAPVVVWSQK